MLEKDVEKRISAENALKHEFFTENFESSENFEIASENATIRTQDLEKFL